MEMLLNRRGRLLLHLREADHGLTGEDLVFRAAEPVTADLVALLSDGAIRLQEGRYHTAPRTRDDLDSRLLDELQSLGAQGRIGFAYGSNMDPEQMSVRVPSARFLCRGRLPGYMLAFPRRSVKYPGKVAGVLPVAEGEGVWGVLYLIDEAGWAALDRFEGYPRSYTKQTLSVMVRLARTDEWVDVPAVVYLPVPDGSGGGPPAASYLARLLRGAKAYGLPSWYQEVLQGTETMSDSETATVVLPPASPVPAAEQTPSAAPVESRSKYAPLVRHLDALDRSEVRLTFAEIERILGFALPPASRKHLALWYPSDTHVMASLLARHGWRATPHLREEAATFRRQWDEGPLIEAASKRLSVEEAAVFRQLYTWAKEHGVIKAGTGRAPGFAYQPTDRQHDVFSAYATGSVILQFGWMCRSLAVERVEAFRVKLAGLPGTVGLEDQVRPGTDQHGELPLRTLVDQHGLQVFLDAVLGL